MQRYYLGHGRPRHAFSLKDVFRSLRGMDKKTFIKNLILFGVALVLFGSLLVFLAFLWYSRDLPDPNNLNGIDVPQSTKIYDRTGDHLLYEIAAGEKRTLVTIDDIPAIVKNATITAEDRDYYSHGGISIKGILRSIFTDVVTGSKGQGGSTITQQMVRNVILTREKSFSRKFKEILLSIAVEKRYTKDQILQLYFNEIGYGSTNYGVESASEAYFGKHVQDVDLAQAATLAAIPNSPTTFLNNPDLLITRRDYILDNMVPLGYASQADVDAAKAEDTSVTVKLNLDVAPHFVLWVKQQLEDTYTQREVEEGGLRVTTTLDYDKQLAAEKAVEDGVAARGENYKFNNAGLVALDPKTGEILAMVGSVDYNNSDIDGQVNVTLNPLQPGSSIKPIIYAAAFARGYTANTLVWDDKTVFPTSTGNYAPNNYDLNEHGPVSLRKALQGSLNIPAVKVLYLVGVENALRFAEKLGYSTFSDRSRFGLSVVLGGAEVKLLEHASAYATFANNGTHHSPVAILKVEDPQGKILEEWKPEEHPGESVVDSKITSELSNVLSDDGSRQYVFGANNSLHISGRPVAAKTGTTNDYNDAWTMGYTPSLAAGVWVGNTNGSEMRRGSDGSIVAAPIWLQFMKDALANSPVEQFPAPSIPHTGNIMLDGELPTTTFVIDKSTGKLATDETPASMRETKVCGDYHDILHFVDKNNPLGGIPSNPASDSMYASWESALTDYIARHNANLKPGETAYETCTKPTEYDDVHTSANAPAIAIVSPITGENVGRIITVALSASTHRPFVRVDYAVDGSFAATSASLDGATFTLPAWVGFGAHTLSATIYDDVSNSAENSVTINETETGSQGNFSITNPFNNQIIEKTSPTYDIIVEVPNASDMSYIEVTAHNTWTGQTTVAGGSSSPSAITTLRWTLGASAEYTLTARASSKTGQTLEAAPITVTVVDPIATGIPVLDTATP